MNLELPPVGIPESAGVAISFDRVNKIHWPVLVVYPEFNQTDLIQDAGEFLTYVLLTRLLLVRPELLQNASQYKFCLRLCGINKLGESSKNERFSLNFLKPFSGPILELECTRLVSRLEIKCVTQCVQ